MNRLQERYQETVVPALTKEFGYPNVMAVPKIQRIVVNMGIGDATQNAKLIDIGSGELGQVHGPVQTQFGFHLLEITSRTD